MRIDRIKKPKTILWLALAGGLIADILLYKQPLGLSYPVFLTLLTVALLFTATNEGERLTPGNALLIIPLLFFGIMLAIRASGLLSALNFFSTLILLGLICAGLTGEMLYGQNLLEMVSLLARTLFHTATQPFMLLARLLRNKGEGDEEPEGFGKRVLIGILITLPVLVIFTALLANADLIFQQGLEAIFRNIQLGEIIAHLFIILFVAFVVAGGLITAVVLHLRPETAELDAPTPDRPSVKVLGMVESGILLFAVDALFLVFVIIQFAVLFGGDAYLQSQGLTYSEYARRGFFELLAVSVIVLGLILLLEWITRRETGGQKTLFLTGAGLMIILTVIMLISAYLRMNLYESAYGYTIMRLYPHVFMVWLGALLLYVFALLLLNKPRLFAAGLLIFCIGFLTTMNVINPDQLIAQQNIARHDEGEELDWTYFYDLSVDALPEIKALYDRTEDQALRVDLLDWMQMQSYQIDWRMENADFRGWHASYTRAEKIFSAMSSLSHDSY